MAFVNFTNFADTSISVGSILGGIFGVVLLSLLTCNSTLLVYFVLVALIIYLCYLKFNEKDCSYEDLDSNLSSAEYESDDDEGSQNVNIKNDDKKHRAELSKTD